MKIESNGANALAPATCGGDTGLRLKGRARGDAMELDDGPMSSKTRRTPKSAPLGYSISWHCAPTPNSKCG